MGRVRYTIRVKWLKPALLILAFLLLLAGVGGYWWFCDWRDHSQDGPILAAARKYGLDPALVKAVVWRESRFNPGRRGGKGEIGLMQLRAAAAGEWAQAERRTNFISMNLFDPGTNTLAGAWYLRHLLNRYSHTDNPVPYALADYNAGHGNVQKWEQGAASTNSAAFIAAIGFPGTKNYVRSVMQRFEHYRPIFPRKEQQ